MLILITSALQMRMNKEITSTDQPKQPHLHKAPAGAHPTEIKSKTKHHTAAIIRVRKDSRALRI